jgi:hypothetical protein
MDTRKLRVKHSNDTTIPFPTAHIVAEGQAEDDVEAVANYLDPEDAAELVRRYNAFPALVEALEGLLKAARRANSYAEGAYGYADDDSSHFVGEWMDEARALLATLKA